MSGDSAAQQQLQWSGQFLPLQPTNNTSLAGDKITLPPSALEQLLSAASAAAVDPAASSQSSTYDAFNRYARITQRHVESQFADQKNALPHPLTFRLVNPENGRVVYAGIREFSADEGEAVLSSFIWQALGLESTEGGKDDDVDVDVDMDQQEAEEDTGRRRITIHARQLPKGTYVKLRPLEAGYDPEDWKALLERHLRLNYTTLTNGEVLHVSGGKNQDFRFLVDGFKPESDAICVVDTDLEVDIEALNEEQARETMKTIADKMQRAPGTAQGSSVGGDVEIFKLVQGQVLAGDYVDYTLPSWPRGQPLHIELEGASEDDDLSLFVSPFSTRQRARPRLDEHVFANLGSQLSKTIRLEPTNVELENAEHVYVSVYAFKPEVEAEAASADTQPRRYTLNIRPADSQPSTNGNTHLATAADDAPPNQGDVRCKNCTQWVPSRTLMLHENFCLRNNILCPHGCGQVFQKRSADFQSHWHCPHDTVWGNTSTTRRKRDHLFHPESPLSCTNCSTTQTFPTLPLLAHHRVTTCPAKPILCTFCHLEMPQDGDPDVPNAEALLSGLTVHELIDGARTTECHLCTRITKLKDMSTHLRHHDLERKSRLAPRMCRNIYCGRTLDGCNRQGDTRAGLKAGQGAGNDVGLCSTCFAPLYVSLYDPENKALKRRIERRYLQQLLTGCGKAFCNNEFCKSGRTNTGVEPKQLNTKDAFPLIKPFVDDSVTGAADMKFCVDETSQKRRLLADVLVAERGLKGEIYALPWWVGALEAEAGNVDKARTWLGNWAPTKAEEEGS